jgi:hypothetical protein
VRTDPDPHRLAGVPHSAAQTETLGWREWAALPSLGIAALKAKLDTGARTSSLHVESVRSYYEGGAQQVAFVVRPRRRGSRVVACAAPVLDRRRVTDSGGHGSERWFIAVDVGLAGRVFTTEINLTDRGAMLFPLLLGRSALHSRFCVDVSCSYTSPRPPKAPVAAVPDSR